MPDLWTVQHTLHDGTLISTFAPENLSFTLNKIPPHTIQYEISLNRPGVYHDFVGPYRTNFLLYYGATRVMGGLHVDFQVGINDDHCTIFGKDWFHYLERRQYPFDARPVHVYDYKIGSPAGGYVYEDTDKDVLYIIHKILQRTLGRPNSLDIDISWINTNSLGIFVDQFSIAAADTTYISAMIEALSEISPGFMYEVSPYKQFYAYTPSKYNFGVVDDPAFADYVIDDSNSDCIIDLNFGNTGPDATHILGHGQGIAQSIIATSLGMPHSQEVYYRLDNDIDLGQSSQEVGHLRTMREFSRMANPQHEIPLVIDPSKLTDFWNTVTCGSALWIDKDLIAHHIQSAHEVVQMDCTVSNEGDQEVSFGLKQIYSGTAGIPEG